MERLCILQMRVEKGYAMMADIPNISHVLPILSIVLSGVTRDMLPYLQETFGPVTPLMVFHSEEEAIAMANDTE